MNMLENVDLIETLWNVKGGNRSYKKGMHFRFNRDIVECKDECLPLLKEWQNRFNRDIMECKDSCHLAGIKRRQRFNRDIVECKDRALNIAVTSREGRVSRNSAIRFAA